MISTHMMFPLTWRTAVVKKRSLLSIKREDSSIMLESSLFISEPVAFPFLIHSSVFQQWFQLGFGSTEVFIENHRVFAVPFF